MPVRRRLLSQTASCLANIFTPSRSFDGSMRQDKREEVIKSFTVPNKSATAGSKEDRKNPMVMLLSLKVRLMKSFSAALH